MRGSWEEARTYSCCDFATRIIMSRAVGTWELMVWRSGCEREPPPPTYCRVTLIDRWSAFCGINESGMFAGFEQFGVLAFAVLFVRATFPLAPDVDVSTAGLLRVLCT